MPTTAERIREALEKIAPLQYAEEWDNVGELIRGARDRVNRVLLTIDLTEPVLEEAVEQKVDMVVAYHPPIFKPLQKLGAKEPSERIILGATRAGLHVYSPHTALDAAIGGVNDWLADCLGSGDRRALVPVNGSAGSESCKIVTFCPESSVDRIRDGLASVGAGTIGEYKRCSFEVTGSGTFHGSNKSSPKVGRAGKLERLSESRLEMVCPRQNLPAAVRALASFHPYEEPPIEIYALEPLPIRETGAGRRIVLDRAISLRRAVELFKNRTDIGELKLAKARNRMRQHRTIGLCAGSGGSLLGEAIAQGCTLYLTGEMSHHDLLKAQAAGCTVLLAGHTDTERGYLPVLARRLASELGTETASFLISRRDRRPLRTV
jgi:dinuclear metal center YbgI/SA1388 family protein